jgi:hypothetical protein
MLNLQKMREFNCPKFSQLAKGFCVLIALSAKSSFSYEIVESTDFLPGLGRGPATYTPNDDIVLVPQAVDTWTNNVIVEDDAGIMVSVRDQLKAWDTRQQYAQEWDLEDTGLYDVPNPDEQERYLNRNILRYLDKRLSGEVKRADSGSTMHTVGKVHNALRPKAEAGISQNIKLKFRAKVLQGRGYVYVENPYVDANAMVSATGHVELKVERSFKQVGVHSRVQYNVDQDQWIAQVDKTLSPEITARISSEQDSGSMMFSEKANQTVQLIYSHAF